MISNFVREDQVGSPNTLAKLQKAHKKNKSRNPDSSNHSLAGSKLMLGNETLQTAACLGITQMTSKSANNSVLICKRNLKKSSMNVLCSVMRPPFIQMA